MQRVVEPKTWLQSVARALEAYGISSPEIAGLAALGLIALVGSLWLVFNWLRRPMGVRLKPILADRDEVAILMHPNPDPDAMACAIGLAYLAELVDTDATLQFPGQIRHQENRAFRTVLDLDLDQIDTAADLAADDVILVDHHTPRGFDGADDLTPLVVVDHHPGDGTGLEFTDQRTDYGACATILAEYLTDIGCTPLPPDEFPDVGDPNRARPNDAPILPPDIATGLLYGILSDTKHLTKGCSDAEFEAAAYLYQGVDEDLLDRIANPQVSTEVLDIKARAIANREVRGSFVVSDVGHINNTDAIPQAADELLHLEGVTAVVVHGHRDGSVRLSGRSRDDRVHMGEALAAVTADIPDSGAGGHARMGGGQLPVTAVTESSGANGGATVDALPALTDDIFAALDGDV